MRQKIIILFFTILSLMFIISFNSNNSYSKYVIENLFTVAKIKLDDIPPKFELLNIHNTNTSYEKYANSSHIITIQLKLTESNIQINNFSQNTLKIKVGNNYISPAFKYFKLISENSDEKIYEISFTNLSGNGSLSIYIPDGVVEDSCDLKNSDMLFDLNIQVDNISPTLTLQENLQEDLTSIITINSSECIRPLNNWIISNDNTNLSKTFYNCISYPLTINDYAQNASKILVSPSQANNISLLYTTYDSYSGFSNSSNGEVCGKTTILSDNTNKTESLFVRLETSSANLKLQGRIFLYTHWGENSTAICNYSEYSFVYGYNPSSTSWYTVNSDKLLYHTKKLFTQFGGIGLNFPNKNDTSGKNPIPSEIANQNLYGISSISFKLTDSSIFSIVYQTYIKNQGWQKVCSDGEESILNFNKPISGIRMNIVPKTDKQYLIDFWNKDIGTSNID